MMRLVFPAFLVVAAMTRSAHAGEQQTRACEFKLKAGCVAGDASVVLTDGAVTTVKVNVFWCNRQRGAPGYFCDIDSSRDNKDDNEKSTWSEEAGATVVSFSSDLAVPNEPDRVKVTVGQDVMIDLNETQVLPRCGAEAEFPKFIVIPEKGKLCRVKLGE